MVYLFLADGFEEIEALGTIDILRRCGLMVQTLSVTGKRVVSSARGLEVKADSVFRKNHLVNCEALVIPGGLKGTESMMKNAVLRQAIASQYNQGACIAAICAGPMVLYSANILQFKHFTMYPGLQENMEKVFYHNEAFVVVHDNIITGCGPAATHLFAVTLARHLVKDLAIVDQVEREMCFTGYDPSMHCVLTI